MHFSLLLGKPLNHIQWHCLGDSGQVPKLTFYRPSGSPPRRSKVTSTIQEALTIVSFPIDPGKVCFEGSAVDTPVTQTRLITTHTPFWFLFCAFACLWIYSARRLLSRPLYLCMFVEIHWWDLGSTSVLTTVMFNNKYLSIVYFSTLSRF